MDRSGRRPTLIGGKSNSRCAVPNGRPIGELRGLKQGLNRQNKSALKRVRRELTPSQAASLFASVGPRPPPVAPIKPARRSRESARTEPERPRERGRPRPPRLQNRAPTGSKSADHLRRGRPIPHSAGRLPAHSAVKSSLAPSPIQRRAHAQPGPLHHVRIDPGRSSRVGAAYTRSPHSRARATPAPSRVGAAYTRSPHSRARATPAPSRVGVAYTRPASGRCLGKECLRV
jgi:hypothetical protein